MNKKKLKPSPPEHASKRYNDAMLMTTIIISLFLGEAFLLKPDDRETRRWVHFFLEERSADTQDALQNSRHYVSDFRAIFREVGIPQDLVWLAMVESGFRRDAVSATGATGMFQFKKISGRAFGLKINSKQDQRLNPIASARAAAQYLAYLLQKFSTWELTLAAYNLGEGDLRRLMIRHGATHWLDIRDYVRPQTKHYIAKIRAAAIIGNNFYHHNPLKMAKDTRIYLVRKGDTLYAICKRFNIALDQLMTINELTDYQIRPGRHLFLPPASP